MPAPPRSSVIAAFDDPKRNLLLAALPDDEWKRWWPQLEAVDLPLGEILCESGSTLSHVYFPTSCIVSLLYVMEDGASVKKEFDRLLSGIPGADPVRLIAPR